MTSISPASSVVAHLAQARSWLALELPCFTTCACAPPSLPSSPTQTSSFSLLSSGLLGLLPLPGSPPTAVPTSPFSGSSSHSPLTVPSQPCMPPGITLITLHIYLWDYLTHVSPHQAANSVRVGTKSVLFTDNPQCLAHNRASNFFK